MIVGHLHGIAGGAVFAALAPADFENADPWATPMCATYAGEVVTQSGA